MADATSSTTPAAAGASAAAAPAAKETEAQKLADALGTVENVLNDLNPVLDVIEEAFAGGRGIGIAVNILKDVLAFGQKELAKNA